MSERQKQIAEAITDQLNGMTIQQMEKVLTFTEGAAAMAEIQRENDKAEQAEKN